MLKAKFVEAETKTCNNCLKTKPVTDFFISDGYYRNNCKACHNAITRERKLETRYGINSNYFVSMLEEQSNRCAICGKEFKKTYSGQDFKNCVPHVDHCHNTGKVRGLLCGTCNTGLGHFKDDIALLLKAILYLRNTTNA